MTYTEAVSNFFRHLERKGNSAKTITTYKSTLKDFFPFLATDDIASITPGAIAAFEDSMNPKKLKPRSRNRHLATIRSFLRYLAYEGISALSPERILLSKDKRHYKRVEVPTTEEIKVFCTFKEDAPHDTRDSLIVNLLYATGLRISELRDMTIDTIPLVKLEATKEKEKPIAFQVMGKGGKLRTAYLRSAYTKQCLLTYLKERAAMDPQPATKILIVNDEGGPLSIREMARAIARRSDRLSMRVPVTAHVLRHAFASHLLDRGADIYVIKELLGHASVMTTEMYLHMIGGRVPGSFFTATKGGF